MPYIVAAYTVAWVTFISYALYLGARHRQARRAVSARARET
jgi:CcmD family protein